jgi:protease YdgD
MALLLAGLLGATLPASAEPQRSSGRFVPTAVFAGDERRALPPELVNLRQKIGVLQLGETSFCTAFCIAGDVIATASHCLLGTTQTVPPDLDRIAFSVGRERLLTSKLDGQSRAAMRARLSSGTALLRVTPPIDAASDWALARLAKPVCRAGGLKLTPLARPALEARAQLGQIYQIAMHRDVEPGKLVYAAPCGIARAFPQATEKTIAQDFLEPMSILLHTCDTGPGSSGSPLLTDRGGEPEVVGINVGTYVLSRPQARTSSTGSPQSRQSEAIANTAIHADQFRSAVESFMIETSAIRRTRQR